MSYSISASNNKLSIVIPRRFSPFFFAFIPLWIGLWSALAAAGNRSGKTQSPIGLLFFGIISALFIYSWLWNLGGREELHFSSSNLAYRRILFGVCISHREFSMGRISRPHFVESRASGKSRIPSGMGFYYDGEEIRLGDHLTQRDSKEIATRIVQRIPEAAECWGHYVEGLPELDEDMTLNLR